MSSANKVFLGDVGTKFILHTDSDISDGTVFNIYYRRPDKTTGVWAATLEGTQSVYYVTKAGDLDQIGAWKFQLGVVLPSWQGRGEIDEYTINARIEISV